MSSVFGDQLKGTTGTSHDSNLSQIHSEDTTLKKRLCQKWDLSVTIKSVDLQTKVILPVIKLEYELDLTAFVFIKLELKQ